MIEDGWLPYVTHVSGTSWCSIDTYGMIWGRFIHQTRHSSPIVGTEFLTGGITSCMNSRCAGALLRDSVSLSPLLPHFKKQPIWMDSPQKASCQARQYEQKRQCVSPSVKALLINSTWPNVFRDLSLVLTAEYLEFQWMLGNPNRLSSPDCRTIGMAATMKQKCQKQILNMP